MKKKKLLNISLVVLIILMLLIVNITENCKKSNKKFTKSLPDCMK